MKNVFTYFSDSEKFGVLSEGDGPILLSLFRVSGFISKRWTVLIVRCIKCARIFYLFREIWFHKRSIWTSVFFINTSVTTEELYHILHKRKTPVGNKGFIENLGAVSHCSFIYTHLSTILTITLEFIHNLTSSSHYCSVCDSTSSSGCSKDSSY